MNKIVMNKIDIDNDIVVFETQDGNAYHYKTNVHPNIVHTIIDIEDDGICRCIEGDIASLTTISTSTVHKIRKAVEELSSARILEISKKYSETY